MTADSVKVVPSTRCNFRKIRSIFARFLALYGQETSKIDISFAFYPYLESKTLISVKKMGGLLIKNGRKLYRENGTFFSEFDLKDGLATAPRKAIWASKSTYYPVFNMTQWIHAQKAPKKLFLIKN